MDFILLDWTRMGPTYCLAGAIIQQGQPRIVRPLLAHLLRQGTSQIGWPTPLFDGIRRWQYFTLVRPEPWSTSAPHTEDISVADFRPLGKFATPAQRRALLHATLTTTPEALFGLPLHSTATSLYLEPGTGVRSLTTILVPASEIGFLLYTRENAVTPELRVTLPIPGHGSRTLPLKDHTLLLHGETSCPEVDARPDFLAQAIRKMGDRIAVRLGVSRPYAVTPERPARCYLMADGFFNPEEPT